MPMKRMVQFLCLLLSVLILVGCAPQGNHNEPTTAPDSSGAALDTRPPEKNGAVLTEQALTEIAKLGNSPDDNYRTWYEIFVYSYCDSNGDGIGDINGVTSKLDELEALGINGIWLMPIHPSTSYHKYNVADYYAIDPVYGTLEDFEAFLDACDQRGIKVIMDLVVNHTGYNHEWFQTALKYIRSLPEGAELDPAECKYVDYYFFSKESGSGCRKINGTEWYYEGMFSPDMPDVNLGNEEVRNEIKQIMEFWLSKGVGGFRLDAAKEFYSGQIQKNIEVLSWIQETATGIDPDCYLVAEVWENFASITRYYESGITSIFNFAFADTNGKIVSVLRGAGNPTTVSSYATALEKAHSAYSGSNPDFIDAPFLSNHDVGRIAGFVARDESKIKLAGAMNVFMSGSVFIYYGEELGMPGSGNDPSKRAPMLWNAARDNGTTNPPPECTLPEEYPLGSLEEQRIDDYSVYNYYRQAIAIRNALPVISHGIPTAEDVLNVDCISAQRKTWGEEECIILMNIHSEPAQVDLTGYEGWYLAASLAVDENPVAMDGSLLNMPAYGVAVLLPTS